MSVKKILEFNPSGPSAVFKTLQIILQEKPGTFEITHHAEFSMDLLAGNDLALLTFALAEGLLPQLPTQPPLVKSLQSFDSFVPEDGHWYPRLFLFEAIRKVLVANARDLDNRSSAFIVGEGAESRVAAAVCAHLGYSEIYLIGDNPEVMSESVKVLSRGHFGIKFMVLPVEELTIQAVSSSLVINTVNLKEHEALLNDLCYFNFLKSTGYALDCYFENLDSPLLEEAGKAGLQVLYPVQVLRSLVELYLEKIGQQSLLSSDELQVIILKNAKEISSSV